MSIRRLPSSWRPLATTFWMTLAMSMLVSGAIVVLNAGVGPGLVLRWLGSWALAWPVAFIASIATMPLVRALVNLTTEPN